MELCEEFFRSNSPPDNLESITEGAQLFLQKHKAAGRCVALLAVRNLQYRSTVSQSNLLAIARYG